AVKRIEDMRSQAMMAKVAPSSRHNFLTKHLNVFVGDALSWFDMTVWDKGGKTFDVEALRGRRCFGGLDLASTRDITAFVLLFPPDEGDEDGDWVVLCQAWVPQAKLDSAELDKGSDYKGWARRGCLAVVPGEVADYGVVRAAIEQACRDYDVAEIAYDGWQCFQMANELAEQDIPMVKLSQNFSGLSPGAKHLERLVYSKRLRHGGNPLLRWCAGNVTLLVDTNENMRPDKKRSRGRIDPIVALCNAASRAVLHIDDEPHFEVIL
ncbi:terminase, partial [Chromobacterium piscinae]